MGVDRIVEVEFGGNLGITQAVIAEGGTVAAYGSMAVPEPVLPFYPFMFMNFTLRMVLAYSIPNAARAKRRGGHYGMAGGWHTEGYRCDRV